MSAKQKKPKARRMWVNPLFLPILHSDLVCFSERSQYVTTPVAVLDVSDEAALIDFVAAAIRDDEMAYQCGASYTDHAMAALTALCVLPKRRWK